MPVLSLPRFMKRVIVLTLDTALSVLSVLVAFYLRTGEWVPIFGIGGWDPSLVILAALVIGLPIFIVSGLYREIFRHSGARALIALLKAMTLYAVIFIALFTLYGVTGVPRTIGIIQPVALLILIGASRAIASYWLSNAYRTQLKIALVPKVLIYGAGEAGRQLAAALAHSYSMRVVGFLDDDSNQHGGIIDGNRIYDPNNLDDVVISKGVSKVLLAIPSINRSRRNEILKTISNAKVAVLTLPSVSDIAFGKFSVEELKPLDIEDLLGRDIVEPNTNLMDGHLRSKVVLVTGAAGSIGSELCRQVAKYQPSLLICLDQNEEGLYRLLEELNAFEVVPSSKTAIKQVLASVNHEAQLRQLFLQYRLDVIYHAAAYKHVPIVEDNPIVGAHNNIFGTLTVARLADEFRVARMILVSTDKAVRPTNVMGATKRVAEMVLQSLAQTSSSTIFSMVRFGNVLNSSGSVVPKFRQQIENGGPITITDLRVTRYFMTIPEAAQLVIQAGTLATGGEVFLLDMGEPIKIIDLAKSMIELSGLDVKDAKNPEGDIEIQEIGLRPGEKLYEELLIAGDPAPTNHPKIFKSNEEFLSWKQLDEKLFLIKHAIESDDQNTLMGLLQELVQGYRPMALEADSN
jgi:FlaA1/EpsC-like NDP-sugar epimerase